MRFHSSISIMLCVAALAGASRANAQGPVQPMAEAGRLTCTVGAGIGAVLGSSRAVHCRFERPGSRSFAENYDGRLSRTGLDLGISGPQTILWRVMTPDGRTRRGMLAGLHSGASFEGAIVSGPGLQLAFDTDDNDVVLQRVDAATPRLGLALAVGAVDLDLAVTTPPSL